MSKAEKAAFDRIAAGSLPKCSAQTLANLMEACLIERHSVVIARDRFGPVVRYEYSVPISVHMRWCEWMICPKRRTKRKSVVPQLAADGLPLFAAPGSST
jgi:hypothetical protein